MNKSFTMLQNMIPLKKAVKIRKDGDFIIAMNKDLEIYYLNETACFFWNNCDGKASILNIMENFIKEYDVSESEIKKDIIELLRDFQWKKLLLLREGKKHEA